jgi:hypothetical protein
MHLPDDLQSKREVDSILGLNATLTGNFANLNAVRRTAIGDSFW